MHNKMEQKQKNKSQSNTIQQIRSQQNKSKKLMTTKNGFWMSVFLVIFWF